MTRSSELQQTVYDAQAESRALEERFERELTTLNQRNVETEAARKALDEQVAQLQAAVTQI